MGRLNLSEASIHVAYEQPGVEGRHVHCLLDANYMEGPVLPRDAALIH